MEVGIPEELLHFFRSPGGHSLIVKGPAGTGKTTFALQLAEELGGDAALHYLSSRVSDESLYNQFQWLRERMKPWTIQRLPQPQTSKGRVARLRLDQLIGKVQEGQGPEEEEKPPGTPDVTDEGIEVIIGEDLPEIERAYDFVDHVLPGRGLLLIDSIDGLAEHYGVPASRLLNVIQGDLVEDSKQNVLYVLEGSGETRLDYLGDGVISLRSVEHTGRRLRVLTIEKLRGTELRQHKFIYTLGGARLRAFRIESGLRISSRGEWRPVPDLSKEVVSTGNQSIDMLIGGLHRSRVVSFEFGSNVATEYVDALRLGLVCNFAAQGRGIAHVPPRKGSLDQLKEILAGHVAESVFDQHVRVFETTSLGGLEAPKGALHMEGSNVDSDLKWSNVEYRLPKSTHPFLSILSFDTLESVYGDEVLDELSGHIAAVRRQGDIFVGFTTPLTKSKEKLASMAYQHIKVENLDGSTVLYCEKPHTVLYNLSFSIDGGCPKAVLTPIV